MAADVTASGEVTELERMVVRIVGDSESFKAMLRDSIEALTRTGQAMEQQTQKVNAGAKVLDEYTGEIFKFADEATKSVQSTVTSVETAGVKIDDSAKKTSNAVAEEAKKVLTLGEATRSAIEGIVGSLASFGVAASLQGMVTQFGNAEKNMLALNAIIAANNRNVQEVTASYRRFALELRNTTGAAIGMTNEAFKTAAGMGLIGDSAEKAVKQASILAAVFGGDVSSHIREAAMLQEGFVMRGLRMRLGMGMGRGGGAGEEHESPEEKAAEAMRKIEALAPAAVAAAGTLSVQIDKLKSSLVGFSKDAGGVITTVLRPLVEIVNSAASAFQTMEQPMRGIAVTTLAAGVAFVSLANTLPTVAAWISSAASNTKLWGTAILSSPITWWVAGIVAGSVALVKLTESLLAAKRGVLDLNLIQKQSGELDGKIAEQRRFQTQEILERADAMGSPGNRDKQLEFLAIEKAKAAEVEKQARARRDSVNRESEGMLGRFGRAVVGAVMPGTRAAEQEARTQAEANLAAAADRRGKIEDMMNALTKGELGKANEGFRKLRDEMEKHIATAGMDAEAIKRDELALLGLTEAQKSQLFNLSIDQEIAQAKAKVREESYDLNHALLQQVETFGVAGHRLEVYKLQLRGLSDDQVLVKLRIIEQLEELEKQKKAMEQGANMMKEFRTPLEKYGDRMEELDDLVNRGAISFETYGKAAAKAKNELSGINKELAVLQGAASGSAEALARIEANRERMSKIQAQRSTEMKLAGEARERVIGKADEEAAALVDKKALAGYDAMVAKVDEEHRASIQAAMEEMAEVEDAISSISAAAKEASDNVKKVAVDKEWEKIVKALESGAEASGGGPKKEPLSESDKEALMAIEESIAATHDAATEAIKNAMTPASANAWEQIEKELSGQSGSEVASLLKDMKKSLETIADKDPVEFEGVSFA